MNNQGTGEAVVLDSSYHPVNSSNPAISGSNISIYCTGLGAVSYPPPTGSPALSSPLSYTTTTPIVTIGGTPVTPSFSGLAPGFVGLYQVNVLVPTATASGSEVPVVISMGGQASNTVTIPVGAPSLSTPFNILNITQNSFTPGVAAFGSTYPQYNINGTLYDEIGFQDGVYTNGYFVYYPYQVSPGGDTFESSLLNGWPHGIILAYNEKAGGFSGFSDASNWLWYDLNANLNWFGKGTTQGCVGSYSAPGPPSIDPPSCQAIVGGYVGAIVVPTKNGSQIYMVPGERAPYPILTLYDSSIGPITDPDAYQTFVPPGEGTTMGQPYGWTEGCYDGRYVYYAPLADIANGVSGNIFRYDTTLPFGNLSTGGKTAAWSNYDMRAVNGSAAGFFDCNYDGNRYTYYTPYKFGVIMRYDTWNGGSGPDGSGFTVASNYTPMDITHLGSPGFASYTGQGGTVELTEAIGGSGIVWDSTHTNQYLYLVPYAFVNATNPINSALVLRVRVGVVDGPAWQPVDITATLPSELTPDWEVFDLALLQENPAWPSDWPTVYPDGPLVNDSTIGGWQLSYVNPATNNIGFVPHSGDYFAEHNIDHHLYDPNGWYLGGPRYPVCPPNSGFGGPYDPVSQLLGPSATHTPLCIWSGL